MNTHVETIEAGYVIALPQTREIVVTLAYTKYFETVPIWVTASAQDYVVQSHPSVVVESRSTRVLTKFGKYGNIFGRRLCDQRSVYHDRKAI